MKDYSVIIENLLITNLAEAYDYGYDQGYADAKFELEKTATNLVHEENDRAYQQGLEDAWGAARKIIFDDGLSLPELKQIFDTAKFDRILKENTASEAISKIKEYEDKQKQDTEIKVGDEVITEFGSKGVVITNVPSALGDISVWFPTSTHVQLYPIKDLSKTGRHYDQIIDVLSEMRSEVNNG